MPHIILRGWLADADLRPISVIKLIKDYSGHDLGAAKRAYDDCMNGEAVEIHDLQEEQALALCQALRQLSFAVERGDH